MTQEEKAKAYDFAVGEVKKYYKGETKLYSDLDKTLNLLFPQLKEESEDDVIIRALKSGFKMLESETGLKGLGGLKFEKILDWTENKCKKECNLPYVETSIKDGVYLVYEDKNGKRWYELFSGHNDREKAIGVAFKFGQVSLRLYNIDIENCKITCHDREPISVIESYADAVCDFMGRKRTQDLVARGLSCVGKLPESKDWYIPAIGELYVMYLMKNQINEALKYIGAELIRDMCYWSSTEYSASNTWYLSFVNGYFISTYKSHYSFRVRPVSEFDPLTL